MGCAPLQYASGHLYTISFIALEDCLLGYLKEINLSLFLCKIASAAYLLNEDKKEDEGDVDQPDGWLEEVIVVAGDELPARL